MNMGVQLPVRGQADVVDDVESRHTELASTEEECKAVKQNLQE